MTTPNDAAVDPVAVLVRDATDAEKFRIGNQHAFPSAERLKLRAQSDAARAAIRELVEAARLARPAGEVGWPSAYILEPAHAARLRAALRRFATGGES